MKLPQKSLEFIADNAGLILYLYDNATGFHISKDMPELHDILLSLAEDRLDHKVTSKVDYRLADAIAYSDKTKLLGVLHTFRNRELGKIKSKAKAEASRENGLRGGRPRIHPVKEPVHVPWPLRGLELKKGP